MCPAERQRKWLTLVPVFHIFTDLGSPKAQGQICCLYPKDHTATSQIFIFSYFPVCDMLKHRKKEIKKKPKSASNVSQDFLGRWSERQANESAGIVTFLNSSFLSCTRPGSGSRTAHNGLKWDPRQEVCIPLPWCEEDTREFSSSMTTGSTCEPQIHSAPWLEGSELLKKANTSSHSLA